MKSKPQATSVRPAAARIRISIRPLLSYRPTRSLPPLNSMQPMMSSMKPTSDAAPDLANSAIFAGSAGRISSALWRHRRHAALSALALSVVAGSLAALRSESGSKAVPQRGAATAVLKDVGDGQHVRWQQDAIDVVVDKTLTDLGGPTIVTRAVDAWRNSGAALPSISTIPGKDRHVGYNPQGPNENVAVYAADGWARANGALAVTVLTFDDVTGRIVDADLLINGGGHSFAVLNDDSPAGGEPVLLENSTSPQSSLDKSNNGKSSRFDVQSVLTHELGHFFGLGEDYDDTSTTMYAKTSPGETHKRILTKSDSTVITGLYADGDGGAMAGASKAGCGGAHVARGHATVPTATWLGWGAAVLGLGLLAGARRSRPAPRMIRVSEDVPAPRSRSARRRAARCGGYLAVLGMVAAVSPRELWAAPEAPEVQGDADVEVISASPRWVDGILETDVTVKLTACRVAACPEGEQHVVVAGGSLDHVTQVVGPYAAPTVGTRATITLRDKNGLMKRLGQTYGTFK
jgi:hypothetical protein